MYGYAMEKRVQLNYRTSESTRNKLKQLCDYSYRNDAGIELKDRYFRGINDLIDTVVTEFVNKHWKAIKPKQKKSRS